mgnify:CR=1 FL=1
MGSLKVREKKKFPVFTLFFLILLCAAGFMFYMAFKEQVPYWISDYKSKQVQEGYTDFADSADGTLPYDFTDRKTVAKASDKKKSSEKKSQNIPQDWNGVDWNGLKKMNPDIIGWIRIPDLAVNYAVLKGTADNYYLYHHMDGSYNILGSIFAEKGTSEDLMRISSCTDTTWQAGRCLDSYPIIRIRAFGRSIPICISIPLRRQERMQYMMFITVLIMTERTPSVLPLAQRISGNG